MSVKTRWLGKSCAQDKQSRRAKCSFCKKKGFVRKATYWSQDESRIGGIVYHCQKHRRQARSLAKKLTRGQHR